MNSFIPFALPDIGEEEINEVVDSMKSGWITTGPKVAQFEQEFANYIGVKHAFAVNSATAGLHLALDAIGLQAGDYVITTINTFTATSEVIRYFDAHPIFCDINPKTFNIDPYEIEKAILNTKDKSKIKAIIPVHIAGQACDMDAIINIAQKYDLKIVEDAAHALPTTYKGKMIGTISDLTVYSFYATKTITTAEGGMIVTNSDDYARRIKIMRLHGFNRDAWDRYNNNKASWFYEIIAPGYKYNMTDIAAAIGIHQLKKADIFFQKRNDIAKQYTNTLKSLSYIETPYIERQQDKHSFHLYIIKIKNGKRDQFIEYMKNQGIGCSVHFIPLCLQPYWKNRYNLTESMFPHAIKVFKEYVSLPIYTKLTYYDIEYITNTIKTIF